MLTSILFVSLLTQWPHAPIDPPGSTNTRIVRLIQEPNRVILEDIGQLPVSPLDITKLVYGAESLVDNGNNIWCFTSGYPKLVVWLATNLKLISNPLLPGSETLNAIQPNSFTNCVSLPNPPTGFIRTSVNVGTIHQ